MSSEILKELSKNPSALDGLSEIVNTVKDKLADLANPSDAIPTKVIENTFDGKKESMIIKIVLGILIIGLLGWSIFLILNRYVINDPEERKYYTDVHAIIFGNSGVFPLLTALIILIIVSPILLTDVLPKLIQFLNKITGTLSIF